MSDATYAELLTASAVTFQIDGADGEGIMLEFCLPQHQKLVITPDDAALLLDKVLDALVALEHPGAMRVVEILNNAPDIE